MPANGLSTQITTALSAVGHHNQFKTELIFTFGSSQYSTATGLAYRNALSKHQDGQ